MSDDFTPAAPQADAQPAGPSTVDAEIASIEKTMFNADDTKNPAYWGSSEATKRYSDLLQAKMRGGEAPALQAAERTPTGDAAEEAADYGPSMHSFALGDLAGVPVFEDFASVMETAGAPQELVDAVIESFDDPTDYSAQDEADKAAGAAQLREMWGDSFTQNLRSVREFLASHLPPGVDRLVMNARIGGKAIMNDPSVLIALAGVAQRSPKVASTGDLAQDIAAIENLMRDDGSAYRKGVLSIRLRRLYASRKR